MILIGQYDSPFVRRVGIALRLYDLPFEHRPWSVYGDAERLSALNPLGGVPTLVLDDGEVLIDSKIILDHLDSLVAPDRRLWPQKPAALLKARQVTALATGLADRAVSLFYERRLHDVVSPVLAPRRAGQITATLAALERDRAARPGPWWCAGPFGHADMRSHAFCARSRPACLTFWTRRAIPRLRPTPPRWRRCRSLPRSASPSSRRPDGRRPQPRPNRSIRAARRRAKSSPA